MLRAMYDQLNDPTYDGDPVETLLCIQEMWDLCDKENYVSNVKSENLSQIIQILISEGQGSFSKVRQLLVSISTTLNP